MEKELEIYINFLTNLKRGFNKGLGKAPHKPILILSIIQLIKTNRINSNRIYITPELILVFKSIWDNLVTTKHISNFALPFFHLRSEPFWTLVTKQGYEISVTKSKSLKSFKSLNDSIAFAEIDEKLFALLNNKEANSFIEQTILMHYFNQRNEIQITTSKLELNIENQILNEDKPTYQSRIIQLKNSLNDDQFQEEIFVRGGLFKKTIPKIYDFQCCISGMKIESTTNAQMVDACHIVPFSISQDDTIQNGICLSPNLHRAYDRGLIKINNNYTVCISSTVTENYSSYTISQFNGKQIILPKLKKNYPSQESLTWHANEIFNL